MPTYELIQITPMSEQVVKRTNDDGSVSFIPMNPSNSDYIAYLEWQAAQTPNA